MIPTIFGHVLSVESSAFTLMEYDKGWLQIMCDTPHGTVMSDLWLSHSAILSNLVMYI